MNSNDAGKMRLLLLDDNRLQSSLYAKYLLSCPHIAQVDCADSAVAAGKLLRQGTYDAAVMELFGQKGDVLHLLDSMRMGRIRRPGIVIVITGVYDERTRKALQRLGVSCLLESPCEPRILLQSIRDLMTEGDEKERNSEKLYEWLIRSGCNPMRSGVRYLVYCVDLCMQDNTMPLKEIYMSCAEVFNTSTQSVECAIRGLKDYEILRNRLSSYTNGKLTSGRIIRLLAERKELWINL